jgi:hypothetical protein
MADEFIEAPNTGISEQVSLCFDDNGKKLVFYNILKMNETQKLLLECIYSLSNIAEIFARGDTTYGLKNYIARYSLASDKYFISQKAFNEFKRLDIKSPMTKSSIDKEKFIYEHPIPASFVMRQIEGSDKSKESILKILDYSDCVTILLQEEDKTLGKKYASKMPKNWSMGDDPHERYHVIGIELANEVWSMKGAIKR